MISNLSSINQSTSFSFYSYTYFLWDAEAYASAFLFCFLIFKSSDIFYKLTNTLQIDIRK